jgi:mxaA protein
VSRRASLLKTLALACATFLIGAQAVAQAPGSHPQADSAAPEASAATEANATSEGSTALTGAEQSSKQKVAPNATVEQPRAFGYVVGDLLTQRVLLRLNGREFVPEELPSPGRIGAWFERRTVHVDEDDSGRRWLSIDYQLMNSPQALRVVTLPAWKIKAADGVSGELRIGEWPVSVAPLTAERADGRPGLGSLRPDRIAPPIPLAPIESRLSVGIAGLLLTALAWVAWLVWRNWRASAGQPFARAMTEMRGTDGTAPEAWYALHRAFDATAGRALRAETLPELFRRAPHLTPLRAQIEEFFRQSAARFFAGASTRTDLSAQALCRELRRIEKRHER